MCSQTPLGNDSTRRHRLQQLERHLQGMRRHLEELGLKAEASAVGTQLTMLRAVR